jgi:ubiquinone/menaquinone biosynthesis C-methylase UbiE
MPTLWLGESSGGTSRSRPKMCSMAMDSRGSRYDTIGIGYGAHRSPEPRWEAVIHEALGDAQTVLNVGAGTGSYEPFDRSVVAVEPSQTMVDQRPPGAAPAARGTAESLPFRDDSFDASLALMTVHHWPDPARGLAELQRVSRRQVIFTWDPALFAERMWFVAEYLPEVYEREADLATEATIVPLLGSAHTQVLPVPFDCRDGVLGAYWRRPDAFLDPAVRSAISGIALLDQETVSLAITRLREDLTSGVWRDRHQDLLDQSELDLGYRLVVAQSSR